MNNDFQSRSSQLGKLGAQIAAQALKVGGWQNIRPEEQVGSVRVDFCADTSHASDLITVCFEVTYGIDEDDSPGLMRTDNYKKIVSDAYVIKQEGAAVPYIVLTSHLPRPNSSVWAWIKASLGDIIDGLFVMPAVTDLREMAGLDEIGLRKYLSEHQKTFWLEQQSRG